MIATKKGLWGKSMASIDTATNTGKVFFTVRGMNGVNIAHIFNYPVNTLE
jgi:hypothetical protein